MHLDLRFQQHRGFLQMIPTTRIHLLRIHHPRSVFVVLLLVWGSAIQECSGRMWTEIETLHSTNPTDPAGLQYLNQADSHYAYKLKPTTAPIIVPPTAKQTRTTPPTPAPSKPPTAAPTTAAPTDPYPPIETPASPDTWYFNYDTSRSAKYGPGSPGLGKQENTVPLLIFQYQRTNFITRSQISTSSLQ